jgi:hypothetical protein
MELGQPALNPECKKCDFFVLKQALLHITAFFSKADKPLRIKHGVYF